MKSVISVVLNNFTNDSRVLKEAITLQKEGYDVKVIALNNNELKEHETVEGIAVHRISLKSFNWSKNMLISLVKYLEWTHRIVKLYKNIDIVHCNDLSALHIGVIIKKFYNKEAKIVYDAHEYETEINGVYGLRKKFSQWSEKLLIKYVDQTITVSESIAQEYVRLYGIEKPSLVLNAPKYKEIEKKNIFRERFELHSEQTIFLYQGNLSKGRGIELLLEAFSQLSDKTVVVFMGYGRLESSIQEYADKYTNIYFHEAVSPDILLNYTSSTDFGISTIENSCLSYYYCLPNKMFEYFMVNIPVIVSNLPEMRRIVEQYEVGVVVKNDSIEGLKETIQEALQLDKDKITENLQELKKIYNWEEQERILLKLYGELYV